MYLVELQPTPEQNRFEAVTLVTNWRGGAELENVVISRIVSKDTWTPPLLSGERQGSPGGLLN